MPVCQSSVVSAFQLTLSLASGLAYVSLHHTVVMVLVGVGDVVDGQTERIDPHQNFYVLGCCCQGNANG